MSNRTSSPPSHASAAPHPCLTRPALSGFSGERPWRAAAGAHAPECCPKRAPAPERARLRCRASSAERGTRGDAGIGLRNSTCTVTAQGWVRLPEELTGCEERLDRHLLHHRPEGVNTTSGDALTAMRMRCR